LQGGNGVHATAMTIGTAFFRHYLAVPQAKILDIGGLDVNGTLRNAVPSGWEYVSVDMGAGPGVDVVLDDPYSLPFGDNSFDAVVSTSAFEHDVFFWVTFDEMCRVCREGGYVYLNAPSNGAYHRFPDDCWRFYPDAGVALTRWAARCGKPINLCESFIALDFEDMWNDFVAIFRKASAVEEAIVPLHTIIPCENARTGATGEPLHSTADTQYLRELKLLRRRLGYDERRSAFAQGDAFDTAAKAD
jgi:SAM-dependent methyltransferase